MGPPIVQPGKAHSFSVQPRTYNHAPRAIQGLRQPDMSDDSTPPSPDAAQPGTPSKPFMRVVKSYVLRTGRVGPGQQRAYDQFGPRFLLNYDASTPLDAVAVGKKSGMAVAPVMIYGDDVTHLVTEEGIAYLFKAENLDERKAAIAAIAGATEIGLRADRNRTADLRARGIVAAPEDLGVRRTEANRSLLAARSIDDLVAWSGGLYQPPPKFRSW